MCVQAEKRSDHAIQVDLVDNWHPRWREVLDAIEHVGQRSLIQVDQDGWLSARHNLLVAFMDDCVAGHLSFRVQPVNNEDGIVRRGRPIVEAQLESLAVQPGFSGEMVESMLRQAARKRANALRCSRFAGLEID